MRWFKRKPKMVARSPEGWQGVFDLQERAAQSADQRQEATMPEFTDFAWEQHQDVRSLRANFMACAYNAAVNYGSERERKKMHALVEAINWYERGEGRVKLDLLVEYGVIEGYEPCPPECEMRPGGLFHANGCENDPNHSTYKARQQRAREVLPGGVDGHAGWRAAMVSLVGGRPRS